MTLPLAANSSADVYRWTSAPPAAPAVANVAIHLRGDYRRFLDAGEGDADGHFTHVALVDPTVDVRDDYTGYARAGTPDALYVPDRSGTRFTVVFVERVGRGTFADHLRVYLMRETPAWPTEAF